LRHGVDGIEPDGLFSSKVLSNDLLVERQPLFCLTISRLVEGVLSRLFIRSIGLPGVGPPIDEPRHVFRRLLNSRWQYFRARSRWFPR
jgi:hypothetical protein